MRGLIIIAGLLLCGCDRPNSRICGSSLAMKLPHDAKTADDQRQVTFWCVERWAARLAAAPDSAEKVADAAFAACEDAVTMYEQKVRSEGGEIRAEQMQGFWRRRALFIVVQTRAGNCYPDA